MTGYVCLIPQLAGCARPVFSQRMIMMQKYLFNFVLLLFFFFAGNTPIQAALVIQAKVAADFEVRSFNGIVENSLFQGRLAAGRKQEIATSYQGLALLLLEGGRQYPLLLDDTSLQVTIITPAAAPVIDGSNANDALYSALKEKTPVPEKYPFAHLMIQAKNLLESSYSIKTVQELTDKRKEFQEFVKTHYQQLRFSDMVRRLIGQYFMMHEYVRYHEQKEPDKPPRQNGATSYKNLYLKQQIHGNEFSDKTRRLTHQDAVISGVGAWLDLLQALIPRQEVLNFCVGLYYNRSMATLGHRIVAAYPRDAFCPGMEQDHFNFPLELAIVVRNGKDELEMSLGDFQGGSEKDFAFVSTGCPVSMVETVIRARQLAKEGKNQPLFVVPLEPLSTRHFAMNRMVSKGRMLFVRDEKWRKKNLARIIRLPLFLRKKTE